MWTWIFIASTLLRFIIFEACAKLVAPVFHLLQLASHVTHWRWTCPFCNTVGPGYAGLYEGTLWKTKWLKCHQRIFVILLEKISLMTTIILVQRSSNFDVLMLKSPVGFTVYLQTYIQLNYLRSESFEMSTLYFSPWRLVQLLCCSFKTNSKHWFRTSLLQPLP